MSVTPGSSNENDKIDYSKTNQEGSIDTINDESNVHKSNAKFQGDTATLNSETPAANHPDMIIDVDDVDDPENQSTSNSAGKSTTSKPNAEKEHFNSEFSELEPEVQDNSLDITVDVAIEGYSKLKMLFPWLLSISDRQLKKMHRKGEIDMDMPIRETRNSPITITVQQYFHKFNNNIEKPFQTSPEFKEQLRPILKEVFKEKGVVVTPMQAALFLVGTDFAQSIQTAAVMAFDRSDMIGNIRDLYQEQKQTNASRTPSTADVTQNTAASSTPAAATSPNMAASNGESAKAAVSNVVNDAISKSNGRDEKGRFVKKDSANS